MVEPMIEKEVFIRESGLFIDKIKRTLRSESLTLVLLEDSLKTFVNFREQVVGAPTNSFILIADRVERIIKLHLESLTVPDKIEVEMLNLAVDWLSQLKILYTETLPVPKSLISELLYSFDLVESSCDATNLVKSKISSGEVTTDLHLDPFEGDPELDVKGRTVEAPVDPFMDDPGFGLAFDLLQRTINFVAEKRAFDADPFEVDPPLTNN